MSEEGPLADRPGPGEGAIILGIFLIFAGLCLTVLGGGCTLLLAFQFFSAPATELYLFEFFFFLSLVAFAVGVGLTWLGIRLVKGRSDRP